MREIVKLGFILLVISAVAAGVLSFTDDITKEPIANQIIQADIASRQQVLPEATEFEEVSKDAYEGSENILEVYKGMKDGQTVGFTIKTNPAGYGGPIEVMVGVSSEGVVSGVNVGNHSETPGLGAKASNEEFKGQYTGKGTDEELKVIKAGTPKENEILTISGATITSKAVTSGVNLAVKLVNEKLK